ncbi:MAG: hypothetical protein AAGA48_35815 [Myxococcota bacterium]
MAVRETLWSLLESTLDAVAEASRSATGGARDAEAVRTQDALMDRLRERIEALEQQIDGIASLETRVGSLESAETPAVPEGGGDFEARITKVDKRLQMAMAAIQAATTQLMEVKDAAAMAKNQAQQANQRATSAQTTAETAADGVSSVEERLAALEQKLDVEGDALRKG